MVISQLNYTFDLLRNGANFIVVKRALKSLDLMAMILWDLNLNPLIVEQHGVISLQLIMSAEKVDLVIILVNCREVLILVLQVVHLIKCVHRFFYFFLEIKNCERFHWFFAEVSISNVPILHIPNLEY